MAEISQGVNSVDIAVNILTFVASQNGQAGLLISRQAVTCLKAAYINIWSPCVVLACYAKMRKGFICWAQRYANW